MEQTASRPAKRVWESVQHYTVKCGECSKWRLIPTKEKYEEIRERIAERPFLCKSAQEWRPQISCEDDADIEQDDATMRWAMDRPSLPQTPSGWQRILRVRAEGGTKFADVYYVSPTNKRLRSMVELHKYLEEHQKDVQEGLNTSQFSFQSPVAMDENYVTKRRCRTANDSSNVPFAENTMSSVVPYKKLGFHSTVPETSLDFEAPNQS